MPDSGGRYTKYKTKYNCKTKTKAKHSYKFFYLLARELVLQLYLVINNKR